MVKILVIEDSKSIRENLLELLDVEDFKAIGAANGKIGIQLAIEQKPDLILCDVMMPEIDGYGVIKALRSNPITAGIPFIFLTAKADKADTRKGMELGADDYLIKPCTADELLTAIATRLEKQATLQRLSQKQIDELRMNITHSLPHELKTPLNGIMGLTEFLISEYNHLNPSEVLEMLEEIHSSSKRLHRLILNFLTYAELEILSANRERNQSLFKNQITNVKSLILEHTWSQVKQGNRENDLQLNLQDCSLSMAGFRLNKIIEELIDNACKFSPENTPISLTTEVNKKDLIISVTNEGRGMTAEQIALIGAHMQFERKIYEQQGSGLGLVIVKLIAELHGGELTIESIPGEHITVSVSLPLKMGEEVV